MFGGEKDSTIFNDTWYYRFDTHEWKKATPRKAPEHWFTMAFGIWNNVMYISTGEGPGKVFYIDVWKLVNFS